MSLNAVKMAPGRMDQRITLERNTPVENGLGGRTDAWAPLAAQPNVWAAVLPLRGREMVEGGQVVATSAYLFTIRSRQDLTEADRIVWNSAPYNIRRIERRGARALYMVIEADRGVAD